MMSTNMQKQQSEAIGILADRILGKFRKFEMLFVLVLMALLIARLLEIPGSSTLLLAAMPFLSMMYFFHAFVASGDEQIDGIGRFVIRLASYSSAIGILGFVFMMYRYPGAEIMVSVGTHRNRHHLAYGCYEMDEKQIIENIQSKVDRQVSNYSRDFPDPDSPSRSSDTGIGFDPETHNGSD
jgi:hypothetical protein